MTFTSVGIGVSDFHLTDIILLNSILEDIPFEAVESFTVQYYGINYGVEMVNNLKGIQDAPDPPISGTFNTAFSQEDKEMSFNALSTEEWSYKITIPKPLLKCATVSDWTIKVDGVPTPYVATEDYSSTSLYFTHSNGTHTVEITGTQSIEGRPYDLNKDNKIDMKDISTTAKAFGTHPGEPRWNLIADIVYPWGSIDMRDISIVARHFGE
jgi:hypothetical protein